MKVAKLSCFPPKKFSITAFNPSQKWTEETWWSVLDNPLKIDIFSLLSSLADRKAALCFFTRARKFGTGETAIVGRSARTARRRGKITWSWKFRARRWDSRSHVEVIEQLKLCCFPLKVHLRMLRSLSHSADFSSTLLLASPEPRYRARPLSKRSISRR